MEKTAPWITPQSLTVIRTHHRMLPARPPAFPAGCTHFPYTKFGVGKVTVHLISQTFDVNEIAGRCKQGAGKSNNPFPVKY